MLACYMVLTPLAWCLQHFENQIEKYPVLLDKQQFQLGLHRFHELHLAEGVHPFAPLLQTSTRLCSVTPFFLCSVTMGEGTPFTWPRWFINFRIQLVFTLTTSILRSGSLVEECVMCTVASTLQDSSLRKLWGLQFRACIIYWILTGHLIYDGL